MKILVIMLFTTLSFAQIEFQDIADNKYESTDNKGFNKFERINYNETKIQNLHNDISSLKSKVSSLENKIQNLQKQIDGLASNMTKEDK